MLNRDYMLEKNTLLTGFLKKKEERIRERELAENRKAYQKAIDKTYDDIIELYKQYDIELSKNPMLESSLKRSYAYKAGGIVNRRNNLRNQLNLLEC